ncbi:MAG: hypothetical protein RR268_03425, partial [Kiritimatiellia bacterium]
MKLNLIVATTLLALATQAGAQTSITGFGELQSAINVNNSSSSGGANLRLDADVTATAKLTEVKKDLTLTGKEATKAINGGTAVWYDGFVISGNGTKLTLKDLLLKNFNNSAVTVNSGSIADITNVRFNSNSAISGGAIFNYDT